MVNKKNKIIIRLIILVITALIIWFLYNWGGNLLKPIAISQIKQLTGARVDINDITFHLSGRISIKNITIGPLIKTKPDNAILTAETLDAYFSPMSFLKLKPRLDRLRISDFCLNVQFNADTKQWNVAAIKKPTGKKGEVVPELRFKQGEIKFSQINKGVEAKTIDCNIRGGNAKAVIRNGKLGFEIREDNPKKEQGNRIFITWVRDPKSEIEVEGYLPRLQMSLFGSKCNINSFYSKIVSDKDKISFEKATIAIGHQTVIDVNGTISDLLTDPAFVFGVKMKDLNIRKLPFDNTFAYGSRIFESFIPLLQVFFDNFSPQGLLGLDVVLTGKVKEIAKTHCKGYLGCKDISIQYFEFPYLVEHLAGRIDVTETSMEMKDCKAAHGQVDITMNGYCHGFGETMDSNIILTSNNMLLDDDLYAALVPNHKKLWYLFSPAGMVSGDFIYAAKPPNTRIFRLYANLLDVSIICHYFPYPVTGITGKIAVDDGIIDLKDILSRQSGGTIQMQGHITDANTPDPRYDFKIQAKDIAIDKKLMDAFPSEQKKFFTDFQMQAKGDADIDIHSIDNNEMPIDYLAKLNIRADSINHPKLPQPLKKVSLDANLTPLTFEIKKFSADFNTSPIAAAGTIWIGSEKEPPGYCMQLNVQNITLDSNTVKPYLGEKSSKLLEEYQFAGPINLDAIVGKNSHIKCPDFQVTMQCIDNTAYLSKLDLPLKNISGKIIINPENLELEKLSAVPVYDIQPENPGLITLDGKIKLAGGAVDWAQLKLKATDLSFDPRFTSVLGKAENYYAKLSPQGKIDLNFDHIILDKNDANQSSLKLNGSALFKNCSIGENSPISNIYAILNIDTQYEFGVGMKECKLLLDVHSLSFKERPVENLHLKIPYDTNNPDIVVKGFIGDCLGGKITGDVSIATDSNGSFSDYQLDIALVGVGTEQFVSGKTAQDTGGATNGELHIRGDLLNPQSNTGRFIAQAKGLKPRQADFMAKIKNAILEVIKRDLALDNVDIQSVIKGKMVYISRIDLYGPTASLRGTGTYEPATDSIYIDFVAYGAAGKENPNFIESLTAGLGAAFLKVQVTGTLEKPDIKVEPLPFLKESLEIIGTK